MAGGKNNKNAAAGKKAADKDQIAVQSAAPDQPEAKNASGSDYTADNNPTENISDERIKAQQEAKNKATGNMSGDDVKTYYSGIADMNISSPKASAIFDQNGFYKTNNKAEIEMLDAKVEQGVIQDRTPESKKKAEKPAENATSMTDLDYLREQATARNISWSETDTIEQLKIAIDEHDKANPADAAGRGKITTTVKK